MALEELSGSAAPDPEPDPAGLLDGRSMPERPLGGQAESVEPGTPRADLSVLDNEQPPALPTHPKRRPTPVWKVWHLIPPNMRMPVVVYAVTQVGFLFWWAALYPGQFSFDSVTYILQVTEDQWMTNHSVLYDVLVWLSLNATGGLAALTLLQTVGFAVAIAYTVVGIRSLGVRGRWLAASAVLLPFFPSVGMFTIYVSKDVPFVISQILLVGTLARIIVIRRAAGRTGSSTAGREWSSIAGRLRSSLVVQDRRMRGLLWLVFAEMAGLSLFRQNGLLVAVAAAVVVAVLLAGLRTLVLLAGVAAALVSVLANMVVFPALGVKTARSDLLLGPAYADMAVIYQKRPSVVYASDRELMSRLAPLTTWRENANCYNSDRTTNSLDLEAAAADSGAMFDLWVRLIKRAPDIFVDTRLCRGGIAWNVETGPNNAGTLRTPIPARSELTDWRNRLASDNPYR